MVSVFHVIMMISYCQDVGLVYELSIIETMYLFGVIFKLKFGHVRERAEFLRKLLDLPPLKRHIGRMRYSNVD